MFSPSISIRALAKTQNILKNETTVALKNCLKITMRN